MSTGGDPKGRKKLAARREEALAMGGPERIARQHAKGRLTARERVDALVDPGSFDEFGLLAASERPEMRGRTPADGKLAGFASILGRQAFVTADDVTVLAGAGGSVGMKKAWRAKAYAVEKGLPLINLGDAGGARMPDILGSRGLMSTAWPIDHAPRDRRVPLISAIMGECFGLPSWNAATSDIVIQVRGTVYAVGGASIIAVATGEQVSDQELGGWELHARTTGAVDLFAEDDLECLALVRRALSYLPSHAGALPPSAPAPDPALHDGEQLCELVPADARQGYDMRLFLAMLCDPDSLLELKPEYDGSLITALARLDGQVVGVLANNPQVTAGAMGHGACEKATSFLTLCDSFHIPLLFIHDTPGFLLCREAEEHKMPIQIMRLIEALHHCTVPRVSLILRKSYGMAHFTMSGGNMLSDQLLAWPSAEVSFMAPEVAVNVMYGRQLETSDDPEALAARYRDELALGSECWEPAALNLIDKVIDPAETRSELARAFALARGSHGEGQRSRRLMASWPKIC
ncbi:carboxyl transferase domain-containing protein [Pseudohaliea sp.]|uniref:acyl-CoA carboxylase subunit beta n=1 Tax=Pseudohaliea sp. TaxID=2740289 RepID=UPI0032EB7C0B